MKPLRKTPLTRVCRRCGGRTHRQLLGHLSDRCYLCRTCGAMLSARGTKFIRTKQDIAWANYAHIYAFVSYDYATDVPSNSRTQ